MLSKASEVDNFNDSYLSYGKSRVRDLQMVGAVVWDMGGVLISEKPPPSRRDEIVKDGGRSAINVLAFSRRKDRG